MDRAAEIFIPCWGWYDMNSKIDTMHSLIQVKSLKRSRLSMKNIFLLFNLLVFGSISFIASAANLTGLDFNSDPDGSLIVKFDFDESAAKPSAYTIERPARIVMDFVDTKSQLDRKKFSLSYGNVESVMVLETADRSRVVVNLLELSPYDFRIDGNSLHLEIGVKSSAGPFVQSEEEKALEGRDLQNTKVTHVDFKRGELGEGNLIFELTDDSLDADVRLESRKIKLTFSKSAVSENWQRNYDVLDFATPVKGFQVAQEGPNVVVTIDPTGDYDYLAYQTDNTYVLSVRPLTQEELEDRNREFQYVGEKLSLNFQDIKVRSVLQIIADFTHLNLVTSDSVDGNITLRLQDVPWDQALDLILRTKGLDKRQVGNVLMVAPAAEIAERERQEIETQKQLQELAPLQTEFIRIRYASAVELFSLFGNNTDDSDGGDEEGSSDGAASTGSILSPRGRVVVDERTNALLITDTADKIEEFKRLIANIDVPLRQVLVEARIVIASDNFDESIGVTWGGGQRSDDSGNRIGISGSIGGLTTEVGADTSTSVITGGPSGVVFPESNFVDLGAAAENPGSLAVGYLSNNSFLAAELSALATDGRGEIVSQPKVITGDKQEAEIKTGEEIPYLEASASGRSTIKFREAVLSMKVTPSITPDNRLILDLVIKQDSRGDNINTGGGDQATSSIPVIIKNEIQTQALVDNGKTLVLGGVFAESELESETKVPLLGDIPLLGRAFKRTSVQNEKNELLIFITPRILADRVLD